MLSTLKKIFIIMVAVILSIAIIFLCLYFFQQFILSEPNVIQRIESPTSEYVAYVFESNGGTTSGFVYRLSILRANETLKKSVGNTYISTNIFDVEWIGDKELLVHNSSPVQIYKQKEVVKGIEINYKYLKNKNVKVSRIGKEEAEFTLPFPPNFGL